MGVLMAVDIKKRAKALVKIANSDIALKPDLFFSLQESIMFTLSREFQIGCASKHSQKFHFDNFTAFVETVCTELEANKEWTVENLEELFIRIKIFGKRQSKVKAVFFWIAHAKLMRQLGKKIDKLLGLMGKENKELKAKREVMRVATEADYTARKEKYPTEIPKYIKATKIDLNSETFKKIVMEKKIISTVEMQEFFNNEIVHTQKGVQLVQLKRQLDAQLEV